METVSKVVFYFVFLTYFERNSDMNLILLFDYIKKKLTMNFERIRLSIFSFYPALIQIDVIDSHFMVIDTCKCLIPLLFQFFLRLGVIPLNIHNLSSTFDSY